MVGAVVSMMIAFESAYIITARYSEYRVISGRILESAAGKGQRAHRSQIG